MFYHRVLLRNFIFIHHAPHFLFLSFYSSAYLKSVTAEEVDLVQGLGWAVFHTLKAVVLALVKVADIRRNKLKTEVVKSCLNMSERLQNM